MRKMASLLGIFVVLYFIVLPSRLDVLMDAEAPYVRGLHSGIIDIDPEEYAASDIRDFSEYGLITIVEFHDDSSEACGKVLGKLQRLSEVRPDVSIKLIHMTAGRYSHWGEQYGLELPVVPYTVLLDTEGGIIAADDGVEADALTLLNEWLNAELKRQHEQT